MITLEQLLDLHAEYMRYQTCCGLMQAFVEDLKQIRATIPTEKWTKTDTAIIQKINEWSDAQVEYFEHAAEIQHKIDFEMAENDE